MTNELTCSISQAARRMGIPVDLVKQLIDENILPEVIYHKKQKRRRLYVEDVKELTIKSRYFNAPKEERTEKPIQKLG